jgi:hypothetical protein
VKKQIFERPLRDFVYNSEDINTYFQINNKIILGIPDNLPRLFAFGACTTKNYQALPIIYSDLVYINDNEQEDLYVEDSDEDSDEDTEECD